MNERILIFSHALEQSIGGVEVFNDQLVRLLSKRGIESKTPLKPPLLMKLDMLNHLWRALYICASARCGAGCRIIIIQYSGLRDILMLPVLALAGKRLSVIAHVGENAKHIKRSSLRKITNLFLELFADDLLIISSSQLNILSHKKISKINTAIDEQFFLTDTSAPPDNGYILFFGRVCKDKGIELLLEAYEQLGINNRPPLKIIGPIDPDYSKNLRSKIGQSKFSESISLEGAISNIKDKILLFDRALFVVYPTYKDIFPLVVIESFARRRVCLSTTVGEIPKYITNERYLFQPGDIVGLINGMEQIIAEKGKIEASCDDIYKKSIMFSPDNLYYDLTQAGIV